MLVLLVTLVVPFFSSASAFSSWCPNTTFTLDSCVLPDQVLALRPELATPRDSTPEQVERFRYWVQGRRGLELGGPTDMLNGLYDWLESCDNVVAPDQHEVFATTGADGASGSVFVAQGKVRGTVLRHDAQSLPHPLPHPEGHAERQAERAGSYDLLIASHILEHMVDPIKALLSWKAQLQQLDAAVPSAGTDPRGAAMLLVLPWRGATFDKHRPPTLMQRLLRKFAAGASSQGSDRGSGAPGSVSGSKAGSVAGKEAGKHAGKHDQYYYSEDLEATIRTWSYADDPGLLQGADCAGGPAACTSDEAAAALRRRLVEPGGVEMLHYHVFDFDLIVHSLHCVGMEVVFMEHWPPFNQVVIARIPPATSNA